MPNPLPLSLLAVLIQGPHAELGCYELKACCNAGPPQAGDWFCFWIVLRLSVYPTWKGQHFFLRATATSVLCIVSAQPFKKPIFKSHFNFYFFKNVFWKSVPFPCPLSSIAASLGNIMVSCNFVWFPLLLFLLLSLLLLFLTELYRNSESNTEWEKS